MKEEWRDVPWYEWLYQVSSNKRVYSFPKKDHKLKILIQTVDNRVNLSKYWIAKNYWVNTLYDIAFKNGWTDSWLITRNETALQKICKSYSVLLKEEVLTQRRDKYLQKVRCECYCYLRNRGYQYDVIAEAFWRTHWAIIYNINKYCEYKHLLKNI